MSETPQKHREIAREEVDALKPFDSVTYSAKLMRSLVNDADRLAKLEDGIRALADELQGEVEQHDPNKSFDEYSGGLADKAEMVEDRLRDLLDGE